MYSYNNISNFYLKSDESGDSLSGQFSVNGDDGQNKRSHHEGSIRGESIEEQGSGEESSDDNNAEGGSNDESKHTVESSS